MAILETVKIWNRESILGEPWDVSGYLFITRYPSHNWEGLSTDVRAGCVLIGFSQGNKIAIIKLNGNGLWTHHLIHCWGNLQFLPQMEIIIGIYHWQNRLDYFGRLLNVSLLSSSYLCWVRSVAWLQSFQHIPSGLRSESGFLELKFSIVAAGGCSACSVRGWQITFALFWLSCNVKETAV